MSMLSTGLTIVLIVITGLNIYWEWQLKRERKKEHEEIKARFPKPITDIFFMTEEEWVDFKEGMDVQLAAGKGKAWLGYTMGDEGGKRTYAFKISK